MSDPLYPRHASASADDLFAAVFCSHCGRPDPRCGESLDMKSPRGTLHVVACQRQSDFNPIMLMGFRASPTRFGDASP